MTTYNIEQLEFINSPLEDSKLFGIPGGGKTQSIIGKILHHFNIKELNKNDNFMILTFSRRACEDFIFKGKQQSSHFNTHNVRTIHSLSGNIINYYIKKQTKSLETIVISALYALRENMDNHYSTSNEDSNYIPKILRNIKVIIVDEAQDISGIQYELIMQIKKIINCSVIMVGDPNQNIYQFQNGSDKYLLNHPGKSFYLIKNYRSSQSIINLINHFKPWASLTPNMIKGNDEYEHNNNEYNNNEHNNEYNNKPIIFHGTMTEIINDVIFKIQRSTQHSKYNYSDIAIIGPVKLSKPKYIEQNGPNNEKIIIDYYTNIGLSMFTNNLSFYDIPYNKHYKDGKDNNIDVSPASHINGVNLYTIHGSKGLEFKQVFLLNFHYQSKSFKFPTQEEYNNLKYLWYVGLSRAKYDLTIYVLNYDFHKNLYYDTKKEHIRYPWYDLVTCPTNIYTLTETHEHNDMCNKCIINTFYDKLNYICNNESKNDAQEIKQFDICNMLNTATLFNEEVLFKLENLLNINIVTTKLYKQQSTKIYEHSKYSMLYGMFIENIFTFFYYKHSLNKCDFLNILDTITNNQTNIILPVKYHSIFKEFKRKYQNENITYSLNYFEQFKNEFNDTEKAMYEYLLSKVSVTSTQNKGNIKIYINCNNKVTADNYNDLVIIKNRLYSYNIVDMTCNLNNNISNDLSDSNNIDDLNNINDSYKCDDTLIIDSRDDAEEYEEYLLNNIEYQLIEDIFKVTLHFYQLQHETGHLWYNDFTKHIKSLIPYINNVIQYSQQLTEEYDNQVNIKLKYLPIYGIIDLMNDNNLIDIKFTTTINIKQCLQILLYYTGISSRWTENKNIELWNFYKGEKYNITFNRDILYDFLKIIASSINKKLDNMIFVYDLETTGLNYSNGNVDIIDCCIIEYNTNTIVENNLVKPLSINCFIPFNITQLTGITTEMVRNNGISIYQLIYNIKEIVNLCNNPIFIAHNGNSFDHKILQKHDVFNGECILIDSISIINLIGTILKFDVNGTLENIYYAIFKEKIKGHRAKVDTEMLIKIFDRLNITPDIITSSYTTTYVQ